MYVFHRFRCGSMLTNSARLGSALSLLRLSVCMYGFISATTAVGFDVGLPACFPVKGKYQSHMHSTFSIVAGACQFKDVESIVLSEM